VQHEESNSMEEVGLVSNLCNVQKMGFRSLVFFEFHLCNVQKMGFRSLVFFEFQHQCPLTLDASFSFCGRLILTSSQYDTSRRRRNLVSS